MRGGEKKNKINYHFGDAQTQTRYMVIQERKREVLSLYKKKKKRFFFHFCLYILLRRRRLRLGKKIGEK